MQILSFLDISRSWKVFIAPHIHENKLKRANMLLWFLSFLWCGIYMFNKVLLNWLWSSMLLKPWLKCEPLHLIWQIQSLLIPSHISNESSMHNCYCFIFSWSFLSWPRLPWCMLVLCKMNDVLVQFPSWKKNSAIT